MVRITEAIVAIAISIAAASGVALAAGHSGPCPGPYCPPPVACGACKPNVATIPAPAVVQLPLPNTPHCPLGATYSLTRHKCVLLPRGPS
jgi:hypothetical protein